MPTVIDSFVLELGLDPSKFTRGQREAMDQLRKFQEASLSAGNQVESQSKRIFDLLSDFRRQALTGLGLFLGGRELGEFVEYVTRLDASSGRLARAIDMNVESLSEWQGAFQQIGGSAESANAALSGLSSEMNRFQLTGQSTMLPVLSRLGVSLYDQNRHLKTAGQLWLDIASAIQGMDPAQARTFLQMIPGANEDMINFALLGRRAMEGYLRAARQAGDITGQSAAAAQEYQRQLGLLDRAATAVGRTLLTVFAPAATAGLNAMSRLIQAMRTGTMQGAGTRALGAGEEGLQWNATTHRFELTPGEAAGQRFFSHFSSQSEADYLEAARRANIARLFSAAGGGAADSTQSGVVEAFIRAQAAARGIDPNVAVQVFRAESGLNPNAVGDQGTSFGVAQLHYGGGLGDVFGPRGRDPSTWRDQITFSLDRAKSHGWGDWHAWHGAPFAGIGVGGGPAGRGGNTTVNIDKIEISGTHINDAESAAREIAPALRRSITAGAANAGAQ